MPVDPFVNLSQDRGDDAMPSLKAGQRLFNRRYELLRPLGAGGMGVVWLARDHTEEAEVALKFLPSVLALQEGEMRRLKEEVRAGKELRHPGIVATYGMELEDSIAAIVMEHVPGKTLKELLEAQERGFFEPAEILRWAEDICAALDYLHERAKRIHRDIKPANILVDATGVARLMDFGISQRIQEGVTRQSKTGEGQGGSSATLAYASPQQLLGKPARAADDLYSLGALLYELLTGTPPFFRGDAAVIGFQITTQPVTPVTERREELVEEGLNASTGQKVSETVEKAVLACLAKNREDRPANTRSVYEMLTEKSGPLNRSEAEIASHRLPEGRAQRGNPLSGARQAETPSKTIPDTYSPPDVPGTSFASSPPVPLRGLSGPLSAKNPLDDGAVGKQVEVTLPGGVKLQLCFCPAGSFVMGSPLDEEGRRKDENQVNVTLTQPFWLARTEFTQAQWRALMGTDPGYFKGDDLPVESVSWNEVQACIGKLNEKAPLKGWRWVLPTEAQWEYACRAGTTTPFHFGSVLTGREANCNGHHPYGPRKLGPNLRKTALVGSYAPNAWGLCDMHGNVWEWCADARDEESQLPGGTNPCGASGSYRVLRGGSYVWGGDRCRAATRMWMGDDRWGESWDQGFRPAAVPAGTE